MTAEVARSRGDLTTMVKSSESISEILREVLSRAEIIESFLVSPSEETDSPEPAMGGGVMGEMDRSLGRLHQYASRINSRMQVIADYVGVSFPDETNQKRPHGHNELA